MEAPKPYGSLAAPWEQNAFGQDLSPARRLAGKNTFTKRRVSPVQLLTPPQPWTTLEYSTIENADVRNELHWSVTNAGTGHGILVWFDAEIAQGISFSTGPFAPETIYGSMFFPWMNPVALVPGQHVHVTLDAKLVENDYIWRWSTRIDPVPRLRQLRNYFRPVATARSGVISLASLRKRAADHVPQLSAEGCMQRRALELMDGSASLDAIARQLAARISSPLSPMAASTFLRRGSRFAVIVQRRGRRASTAEPLLFRISVSRSVTKQIGMRTHRSLRPCAGWKLRRQSPLFP